MGSVECSVQMFLFFPHNHKSYLLLSVCLIGRNLGCLFQDGVRNVLSVLFEFLYVFVFFLLPLSFSSSLSLSLSLMLQDL